VSVQPLVSKDFTFNNIAMFWSLFDTRTTMSQKRLFAFAG